MPIDGLGQVVLPLDADVGVPLADDPHVLLEHPPVTSGDADLELEQRPGPRAAAASFLRARPGGLPALEAGHGDPAPCSPPPPSFTLRRRRLLLLLLPAELLMARTSGGRAPLPLQQPQRGEPAAPAPRTI